LMRAVDKDPSRDTAAERLATLYRDKGDQRALVALHKKRADALSPSATGPNADPARVQQVSMLHEELGRLWQEAPLSQPKKAIEHLKKAFEIDPSAISAVYAARELIKAHGDWREALPLYDLEADGVDDSERKLALHRDEAALCLSHGDNKRACEALRKARMIDNADVGLAYELASTIVTRALAGERMPDDERAEAADILVSLAEQYEGDHALAYSVAALDVQPGHERAMQLADHFSKSLGREDEIAPRWEAYLKANPEGLLVVDARKSLAGIYEQQGKLDAAITALSPLKDDPDPSVATRLTDLFTRAGKTTELAALIERQSSALPPAERLRKQAEIAGMLAQKGDKKAALAKYQEVLQGDPQHPEGLSYVEHALRAGKQWKDLRELFLNAARSSGATSEARAAWLREVAIVSEQKLDDVDGSIEAHRQVLALDRGDELSTAALHRLFEKTSRWDDLAAQLEQDAASAGDVEQQIALEKKLSDLHANKRGDKREAAEALLRVLQRAPKDDSVLGRAVDLLVDAGEQAK
ncbi:MAG: tetratricopeptide repeat protein, partial [Polyangiales bacterium]